jgi:hypothetical protein
MTICIHHIASIAARHDPDTHWVEVDFIDRLGKATRITLYTTRDYDPDNQTYDWTFAEEITKALNGLSKWAPKGDDQ